MKPPVVEEADFRELTYEEQAEVIEDYVKVLQGLIEWHVADAREGGRDGVRVLLKCFGRLSHMLERLSAFPVKANKS